MRALLSLLFCTCLAPTLGAQGVTDAARRFFDARSRRDWGALAGFVDSAGVARVREMAETAIQQVALLANPATRSALESAGLPEPVQLLDVSRSMTGGASLIAYDFARVKDSLELRALAPRDLVARWLEAKDPGYLMRLMMNGFMGRVADIGGPELREQMTSLFDDQSVLTWDILGDVASGPETRTVVYRVAGEPGTGSLSFRNVNGEWLLAQFDREGELATIGRVEMSAMQHRAKR